MLNHRLCLVTATDIEFRIAAGLLRNPVASFDGDLHLSRSADVVLLKTEIGAPGFPEKFDRHLSANPYDAVLIAGLGGALDPGLRRAQAVVCTRFIRAADGASISSDRELSERVAAALGAQRGVGLTTDRVIVDAREKQRLYGRFGATVVDMESYGVLAVCARNRLPAAVLRVISDEAGEDLPDFNRVLLPDGGIDKGKLFGTLLGRPRAAWRFLQSLAPAADGLKKALASALPDLTKLHMVE
ncbi:MAG: hypothetical protein KIT57_23815 [Blastocatellales bacterium]|nr:hypothetical protein [Blastocatellales bacterium]